MSEKTFEIASKEDIKKANATKKANSVWKIEILRYLVNNPKGATDIEIYDATRPDRLEISAAKKKHNVASQWTYITQDNLAVVEIEDDRRVLKKLSQDAAKALGLAK